MKNTKSKVKLSLLSALCSLLLALCFSCDLNANKVILRGACGETADTEGVKVIEINKKNYYYKDYNYYVLESYERFGSLSGEYLKKGYTTIANANENRVIENSVLFNEVRSKLWNKWLPGKYEETRDGSVISNPLKYNFIGGNKYSKSTYSDFEMVDNNYTREWKITSNENYVIRDGNDLTGRNVKTDFYYITEKSFGIESDGEKFVKVLSF